MALMKTWLGLISLAIAAQAGAGEAGDGAGKPPLLGFSSEGSVQQRALETTYDGSLSAADLEQWMSALSAKPHHLGSAHGRANVDYLAELFRKWGYEVEVARYSVLFPTPKHRRLRLLAPTQFEASLQEAALAEDASTSATDVLPAYNAFSPDGDVTAELVFVNYGVQEDYELLARYGIDVRGKIVIAKYGHSWRGIKPKLAADHGAIGALIYSDPADDGYAQGEVYPEGAFKHPSGVQRGSVMELPLLAGDVLTPGVAATKRARRLARDEADALADIPVLPISYADARPLLEALAGPVAPSEWRGALPITYHLGPGPARVRLELEFNWDQVEARNVIAKLPGRELKDRWVLRGNHHDSWNHGASDPVSGLVALLAEAKAVASLQQRPRRTVIYAAWDAEEPGLIGSTEWAEEHAAELSSNAVVYLNTDSNGRGFLGLRGSATLGPFLQQIAAEVVDPQTGATLAERARAWIALNGTPEQQTELAARGALRLMPLGSGSDYTPFLQHLGIASANMGFGGENRGGSYHSLYDTLAHYQRFGDPGYEYGVSLAQVAGRATLRMANADILPFDFAAFGESVAAYADQIVALADGMRADTDKRNQRLEEGTFALALDPHKSLGPPASQTPVPHLNLAPLHNALATLARAIEEYQRASMKGAMPAGQQRDELNALLFRSERALLNEAGLPGRPWYKHQVYAPGYYTGYGAKTLPALREAIEQREFAQVDQAVQTIVGVIDGFSRDIDQATSLWSDEG